MSMCKFQSTVILHLEARFQLSFALSCFTLPKGFATLQLDLQGGALEKLRRVAAQVVQSTRNRTRWILWIFLYKNCMVKVRMVRPGLIVYFWTEISKDACNFLLVLCTHTGTIKSQRAIKRTQLLLSVRHLYTLVRSIL